MSLRILMVAVFISTAPAYAQEAGVILYHGKIVTADQQFRLVDSIAIRGERIVGIGAREEVARLAGPTTAKIDLRGRTVLPGWTASHVHSPNAAMYDSAHPVPQ